MPHGQASQHNLVPCSVRKMSATTHHCPPRPSVFNCTPQLPPLDLEGDPLYRQASRKSRLCYHDLVGEPQRRPRSTTRSHRRSSVALPATNASYDLITFLRSTGPPVSPEDNRVAPRPSGERSKSLPRQAMQYLSRKASRSKWVDPLIVCWTPLVLTIKSQVQLRCRRQYLFEPLASVGNDATSRRPRRAKDYVRR